MIKIDTDMVERNLVKLGKRVSADDIEDVLHDAAEVVIEKAQRYAPRRTGIGAESIHAETTLKEKNKVQVGISWDKKYFYMGFQEFGTSKMPASPFLRPAFDTSRWAVNQRVLRGLKLKALL